MQLTAELWQSLVSSIRCEQRKGVPEKRRSPRVHIRARVTMTPVSDGRRSGPSFEVWTRDVSSTGISFTSHGVFESQQQMLVELPRKRGGPTLLLATVRNCRKLTEGLFSVGMLYQVLELGQNAGDPAGSSGKAAVA